MTVIPTRLKATGGGGSGTVTSVAMTVPSVFSVAGSPITSSGTLAVSLATQVANRVWAGPTNGADATPTFRFLVASDIPDLSAVYSVIGHTHAISDVTGLQTALDGKAASSHTHAISDVTNLQTSLDAKQAADATLTALAGLTIANGSVIVGTGSDAFSVVTLGNATFLYRNQLGTVFAATMSDFATTLIDDTSASQMRTTLGATTVGGNFYTLSNPSAVTFPRINADNTVTARTASEIKTDLGFSTPTMTALGSDTNFGSTHVELFEVSVPNGQTFTFTFQLTTTLASTGANRIIQRIRYNDATVLATNENRIVNTNQQWLSSTVHAVFANTTGSTATVQFEVKATAGTYTASVNNSDGEGPATFICHQRVA